MAELFLGLELNDALEAIGLSGSEVGYGTTTVVAGGDKMYIAGSNAGSAYQYDLTTDYDISTAGFTQSYNLGQNDARAMTFNDTGDKMYSTDDGEIRSFSLTTAWDISTASALNTFTTTADDFPSGLAWNNDGTTLLTGGSQNENALEYTCTTAYDISTASLNNTFDTSTQISDITGVAWNDTGSKFYASGSGGMIYSYTMTTNYDISTATVNNSKDVSTEDSAVQAIGWKPDGSKMYMVGSGGDNVYSYNLSTNYDLTTATLANTFSVGAQDSIPAGIAWKTA